MGSTLVVTCIGRQVHQLLCQSDFWYSGNIWEFILTKIWN